MMVQGTRVEATEVWVMENYKKRIWTKKLDLAMEMPRAFYSSDVVVSHLFKETKFYNFVHGGCVYSPMQWPMYRCPDIFPFLLDFEPCNFFDNRRLNPQTMVKILRKRLLAIQNKENIGGTQIFNGSKDKVLPYE